MKMKMNSHIDTKVRKTTAKQRAFENSILRESSQLERVQMKTIMSDEMMNSKTMLAVYRADSVSNRERKRERERSRRWERERERE
jgi:hypothetical protein